MMLRIDGDAPADVHALLGAAGHLLDSDPTMCRQLHDGTLQISCPLPMGYRPAMYSFATELRARLNRDGRLFEISEGAGAGSGGWVGSCIPPRMYRTFLQAWIAFADQPKQLDLFAGAAA